MILLELIQLLYTYPTPICITWKVACTHNRHNKYPTLCPNFAAGLHFSIHSEITFHDHRNYTLVIQGLPLIKLPLLNVNKTTYLQAKSHVRKVFFTGNRLEQPYMIYLVFCGPFIVYYLLPSIPSYGERMFLILLFVIY